MSLSEEQRAALQVLINSSPQLRKALVRHADKKLICTICEVVYNLLRGNVELQEKEKKKLRKHKTTLRALISKGKNWKQKKTIIQKGGNLLLAALAPIIGSLLGRIL
jgi:hypothetical protein